MADLEYMKVRASEIRVGDRLGRKTKVHTRMERGDKVLLGHKTVGSKGGGVSTHGLDEIVGIFRDRRKP